MDSAEAITVILGLLINIYDKSDDLSESYEDENDEI